MDLIRWFVLKALPIKPDIVDSLDSTQAKITTCGKRQCVIAMECSMPGNALKHAEMLIIPGLCEHHQGVRDRCGDLGARKTGRQDA